MNRCVCCKELISPSSLTYKVSSGFVGNDGSFVDDISILVHADCTHLLEPFQAIEEIMSQD